MINEPAIIENDNFIVITPLSNTIDRSGQTLALNSKT
jgi:hypothetical protein